MSVSNSDRNSPYNSFLRLWTLAIYISVSELLICNMKSLSWLIFYIISDVIKVYFLYYNDFKNFMQLILYFFFKKFWLSSSPVICLKKYLYFTVLPLTLLWKLVAHFCVSQFWNPLLYFSISVSYWLDYCWLIKSLRIR